MELTAPSPYDKRLKFEEYWRKVFTVLNKIQKIANVFRVIYDSNFFDRK